MREAKVRKTGVRVQFRKMQPDPCFSPYRRDSERALTRFASATLAIHLPGNPWIKRASMGTEGNEL